MRRWLTIVALLCGLTVTATAGDDGGTTSPFSLGAGSRELALGGSALASADATTAIYWNPARLARAEYFAVTGFYSQLYESDVTYQYASAVLPTLDFGTIGIGIFRLGIDNIERRDENNLAIGSFSDSRLAIHVAYARQWAEYDVGFSATFEHQSLDDYSATSSPGLTLSVGRRFGSPWAWLPQIDAYLIGRNMTGAGIQLADEEYAYPVTAALGAGFTILPIENRRHIAQLSVSVQKTEQLDPRLAVGLEYSFASMLQLRSGLAGSDLSIGGGVAYRNFSFDYALIDRDLGSLHLFTLTTSLGNSVSERLASRAASREREFNNLMSERLFEQNKRTVDQLLNDSKQLRGEGDLIAAADKLDRALFLARGSNLDTAAIAELLVKTEAELTYVTTVVRHEALLDSARTELGAGNYMAARYFANLVLSESPGSEAARTIEQKASSAINESNLREELIRRRLATVDSLVNYGQIGKARPMIHSVVELAPDEPAVQRVLARVEFEHWRQAATDALARQDFAAARTALDTVAVLFPGHQWAADFEARLRAAKRRHDTPTVVSSPVSTPAAPMRLSPELRSEVEDSYAEGQRAFQSGELTRAIVLWERVERLAPDFESVRAYLVNAYKFVGVELYGKNQLEQAVTAWRKAAALDPDNPEIAGYIRRTETEIMKLKELSYEQE